MPSLWRVAHRRRGNRGSINGGSDEVVIATVSKEAAPGRTSGQDWFITNNSPLSTAVVRPIIRPARDDDILPAFRRRCLFARVALARLWAHTKSQCGAMRL
jgi:hypothetical protein